MGVFLPEGDGQSQGPVASITARHIQNAQLGAALCASSGCRRNGYL